MNHDPTAAAARDNAITKFLNTFTKLLELAYTFLEKKVKEDEKRMR